MKRHGGIIRLVVIGMMIGLNVFVAHGYYSYGARATGMGGAFTALANDGSAIYWNPGNLALINGWTIEVQYGRDGLFAEDVREDMDFLRTFANQTDFENGGMETTQGLWDKDWLVRGGDTLSLVIANQYTAFHFSQFNLFYTQPHTEGSGYRYDMSAIDVKEYGVSFGILGGSKGFSIGVTGKYIDADAYYWNPMVWEIPSTDPGDLYDVLEDRGIMGSDNCWSVDAGLMMVFGTSRVGFSARNLFDYEIEINDETRIEVAPEYRLGYAFQPAERFVLAVDYSIDKEQDLLGNELDGDELAAGFEAVFFEKQWFVLRGGVSMPMDGDAPMIFSAGAGLNLKQAIVDVGYAFDQERDTDKLWWGARFNF